MQTIDKLLCLDERVDAAVLVFMEVLDDVHDVMETDIDLMIRSIVEELGKCDGASERQLIGVDADERIKYTADLCGIIWCDITHMLL